MFEKRSDLIKFLCVVETGKIQLAAAKLNIAQPALSRTITKLEEQFDGQLFERIPTGVRLTPFGSKIAEQARHIVREIELAESEVNSAVSGRTGNLRVSAGPMWVQAILPSVIKRFHKTYPGTEIQLRTSNYKEGVEMLTNGLTDLHCGGFDSEEPLPQFLKRDYILDMNLGVVAHRKHPLFKKKNLTYDDLVGYPWLGYDSDTLKFTDHDWPSLTTILDELFEKTGKRVQTIVNSDSAGLFLMGTAPYLAYLSTNFAEELADLPLKQIPLNFKERRFRSGIIARRSIEGATAFKHFNEIIRDVASKYS